MKTYPIVLFSCIWLASYFFLSTTLSAQILNPTKARFDIQPKEAKVGDEITLFFYVDIEKDWYIYSSDFTTEGPIPTSFEFAPHSSYQLVGKFKPINSKKKYDDVWEGDITYFEKKAEFQQKIKILQKDLQVNGSFEFQTCSNITGQCLAPKTITFSFDNTQIKIAVNSTEEKKKQPKEENKPEEKIEEIKKTNEAIRNSEESNADSINHQKSSKKERLVPASQKKVNLTKPNTPIETASSLVGFMALAFLAGFLAILTPCVFPMIPMTVTFFTKNRKKKTDGLTEAEIIALERKFRREAIRKALFYGFSIIAIYTLLGTAVAWINGPAFANWLSTHWLPNLFFFLISVIFGLSFLGAFELVLPSSWVNKADQEADKGGYYGIFFMAFTLALVSFSCTGPIVGSLLVQSAGGLIVKPILGMFAFSLAIALPFTLFAVFPTWLNSLPKSGGWLNNVKVVLGFLEIALAFKFLSIPDQTYHWGILDRDVYLAFWITIFGMIGVYLLGGFRMPHDSVTDKTNVTKTMLAMCSFAFVFYMIPGLFGAPLKPLAGYLPPQNTLDFDLHNIQSAPAKNNSDKDLMPVKYADILHLPHNLKGFFDYKEGVEYAKKVNKPIFIDFTGHGCVNCREMEARVWSDASVLERLNNDFVVIALYVDDKTRLPESEWVRSEYDKQLKKTIGAINADFQITRFQVNAQPYYCLLDHEGNLLVAPKEYDLNVNRFIDFLEAGKKAFKEKTLAKK